MVRDSEAARLGTFDRLAVTLSRSMIPAYASHTGGVPWVWNDSIVFSPHAWPFLRSSSVQTIGFQSGARIRRAPALATSTRLPPGSSQHYINVQSLFDRIQRRIHRTNPSRDLILSLG
jgi:hypothetical protein